MRVINVNDHVLFNIPEKEDNAIEALVHYVVKNAREQNRNTEAVSWYDKDGDSTVLVTVTATTIADGDE